MLTYFGLVKLLETCQKTLIETIIFNLNKSVCKQVFKLKHRILIAHQQTARNFVINNIVISRKTRGGDCMWNNNRPPCFKWSF